MYVRWLRGFADGNALATSTEPDTESQQELYSRLGRGAPAPAVLAAVRARWATTRRAATIAFANVQGKNATPPIQPPRGVRHIPPSAGMSIALAGAELPLGTGTTAANRRQCPRTTTFSHRRSSRHCRRSWPTTRSSGRSCVARRGPWVRSSTGTERPSLIARRLRGLGRFWYCWGLLYRSVQGVADRLCIPACGGLRAQVLRGCHDGPLGGHFKRAKTGRLCGASLSGWARTPTSPSTCAHVRRASAPRRSTAAHAGSAIPCRCRRGALG